MKIAKEAIRKNYTAVLEGLANPDDVAEYLHGEVDPPLLTENMLEEVKVLDTRFSFKQVEISTPLLTFSLLLGKIPHSR